MATTSSDVTTSSDLTAGKAANGGQGGKAKGHKGRAAGLVATAALGLALLTGLVFSQARPAAQPAAAPMSSNPIVLDGKQAERGQVAPLQPLVIMGETPCPLGGTAPCGLASTLGVAPAQPLVITGETPCPLGGTAPCGLQASGSVDRFVANQLTYREDHRDER